MGKGIASVVLLVTAAGALVGCGESAAESGALDAAVTSFERAQVGYVPGGSEVDARNLRAHRQQALGETSNQLDELITSGSEAQQIAARRLQASIDVSAAHYAAREAAMAYSTLGPRAVELMSHAMAASSASARSQSLDLKQPELIKTLQTEIEAQTKRQQTLQAESAELTSQLKAEQAEFAKLQKARDQATAAAQSLRDQGFIAEGEQQYDLYDQAAQKQREASVAMAEMERRQLNIDMLNSRLDVVNSQLSLTNELLSELRDRVNAGQQRQQEIEQGVAAAQTDRDTSLSTLTTQFQEILTTWQQQVDRPLDAASQRMAQAIEHLQTAKKLADGGDDADLSRSVQAQVLTAMTTRAQLLNEHRQLASGFHQILSLLSESVKQIDAQKAGVLETAVSELAARRDALSTAVRETVASAKQVADDLTGGSGDIAEAAQAQTQRLDQIASAIGNG